jgi:DNA-binding NarL/FixJ family response regulator
VGAVRVVIAEDGVLLREGIARVLQETGFEVTAQVGDLDGLRTAITATQPDVALLDIRMPPTFTDEGLQAARWIRATYGDRIGVVVLSQHLDLDFALGLIGSAQGGMGYLLKERVGDVEDLVDALRTVGRGGSVVDPTIVRSLLRRRERDPLDELTERERDVLGAMAEGRSNAAICDRLGIGAKTVEAHISTIFSKLGLEPAGDDNRRVLAVLAWLHLRDEPA